MPMFRVDEKCTACGICADVCVSGIISCENGAPHIREGRAANCLACGQCVAFCPTGACDIDTEPGSRMSVDRGRLPSAESAWEFLRSRRSVRLFEPRSLSRGDISDIFDKVVRYAPTAGNAQNVRWIVTETREKTAEIAGLTADGLRKQFGEDRVNEEGYASRLRAFVMAWERGRDLILRGAPHLAVAVMPADAIFPGDGAIALTYLELAAFARGVGCCWAGLFTMVARTSPELRSLIGVRDDEMVTGAQMMGIPQKKVALAYRMPPRNKPDLSWL